jgi:hypothetical protein
MDVQIDISATDARFGLYAAAGYELTVGGLSLAMSAEQFQQLCDNLRPWIVDDAVPSPVAWTRTDDICDDEGRSIGTDEPRVVWGSEHPDPGPDGETWWPLYDCPRPVAA